MNGLQKLLQNDIEVSMELVYILLLLGLFVVPRLLQRFSVPRAVSSMGMGGLLAYLHPELTHDSAVTVFSTLGIVSLFLFAGLEVDVHDLRKAKNMLGLHLGVGLVMLAVLAWLFTWLLDLEPRASTLLALAIVTPSGGFILESLDSSAASERERYWIRTKVISTELLALGVLFVTLKSRTMSELGISAASLLAMVIVLPWLFRMFAKLVAPYAPKSEFAFLIMVAVVCALLTKKLGVYYLVGAFVVGMAAQRFRVHLPAMASERMLHAIESFASLFVPFYFFHAGLELEAGDFKPAAVLVGLGLLALATPLRIAVVSLSRKAALKENWREGWRVSISLLPTLVFTLVLATILREQFGLSRTLFGGLIVYALVSTVLPTWILRLPPPEFDEPSMLPNLPADLALAMEGGDGLPPGATAGAAAGTAAPGSLDTESHT